MKKAIIFILIVALVILVVPGIVYGEKPDGNKAKAQEVDWNLSADVMPVPKYGSKDIPGSDTVSKLIVNQPNGKVEVAITGVMNGLDPNTTYTVYLSNGYTKYSPTDITGTYTWLVLGTYSHDLIIDTQNPDGTFSGTGGYPSGSSPYTSSGQTSETITGSFTGNQVTLTTTYLGPHSPGYSATAVGTIAADGSMSGIVPWEWHTTGGAVTLASGSTGWPGLFNDLTTFTFTTDEFGSASWHINLRDEDFPESGDYTLSVWINDGGTLLVSDNFDVSVEVE